MLGQYGNAGLQSILGGYYPNQAGQAAASQVGSGLQNMTHQQQMAMYQQQVGQFNNWAAQMQQQKKPKLWKFDGVECDVREMADKIWTTDCPEKTHFILKYE